RTFESMAALTGSDMNMTGEGDPEHLSIAGASAQFFHVLGIVPVVGRDFDPAQDQPGHDSAVVLLSNKFWRIRFGLRRDIVGETIHLDGKPYTVIGVLPSGEPWLNDFDAFVPYQYDQKASRGSFEAMVIGRLKPGVSLQQAHADL